MRRQRRSRAKPPATQPCSECGLRLPATGDNTWRRCDDCRHARPSQLVGAMLARLGIDASRDDPAVVRGLRAVAWRASANAATCEPLVLDGIRQPMSRTVTGRVTTTLALTAPVGLGNAEAWAHLNARDVRRAIDQARADIAAEREPVACSEGPCLGCGTRLAVEWARHDRKTPNGHRLVLCGPCSDAWQRAGETFYDDHWRNRLCALALDVKPTIMLADAYGFLPCCDIADADRDGYPEPFGYVDPEVLAAAQMHYWRSHPSSAPPEVRQRLRRREAALRRIASSTPKPPPPPMTVPGREPEEVSS
jgi:hypothetical protein